MMKISTTAGKTSTKAANNTAAAPRRLGSGLMLLYEDRDLAAVDKPAGLLSISREGGRDKTVYSLLSAYLRRKNGDSPAVVHRLDRDTSGVMIFAKSGWVKKKLMEHWDEAVTQRRYVCVAEGYIGAHAAFGGAGTGDSGRGDSGLGGSGVIDLPLGEDRSGKVIVKKGGKPALTRWTLL
ncbi:MAG: pseudouridine synthase, partial [Treponema sp.]|nr:pseudouridine synthase [Treponema sp.]